MSVVVDVMGAQSASIQSLNSRAHDKSLKEAREQLNELRGGLYKMEPGDWGVDTRVAAMALVLASIAQLARKQTRLLQDGLGHAARVSTKDAARTLNILDYHYGGVVRPLQFNHTDWIVANAEQMSRARVREFSRSFALYGAKAVGAIEDEVTKAIILGEPWTDARKKVLDATRHVVGNKQWMVDRILYTEISAAYNGSQLAAMIEEDVNPEDRMMKRLVATFDDVTGLDSMMLHGQTRPVREPFMDAYFGRTYMHPPNRPHDREVIVPWRSSYGDNFPGGSRGYVAGKAAEDAYSGVGLVRGEVVTKAGQKRLESLRAAAKKPKTLTQVRRQLIRGQLYGLHRQLTHAIASKRAISPATAGFVAASTAIGVLERRILLLEYEQSQISGLATQLKVAHKTAISSVTIAQAAKMWGISYLIVLAAIRRGELTLTEKPGTGMQYIARGAMAKWLRDSGKGRKVRPSKNIPKAGSPPPNS